MLILLILFREAEGRREVSARVVDMMLVEIREVDGCSLTFLDTVNVRVIASVVSVERHILSFAFEAIRFMSRYRFRGRPDGIAVDRFALFLHKINKN